MRLLIILPGGITGRATFTETPYRNMKWLLWKRIPLFLLSFLCLPLPFYVFFVVKKHYVPSISHLFRPFFTFLSLPSLQELLAGIHLPVELEPDQGPAAREEDQGGLRRASGRAAVGQHRDSLPVSQYLSR